MKVSNQGGWLNGLSGVSLVYALFLLLLLPAAFQFRSPGGMSSGWHICALATAGLIVLNGFGIRAHRHRHLSNPLGLYVSTGVAVGVFFMLLHAWQEQQQYDLWSHRGISYFNPR